MIWLALKHSCYVGVHCTEWVSNLKTSGLQPLSNRLNKNQIHVKLQHIKMYVTSKLEKAHCFRMEEPFHPFSDSSKPYGKKVYGITKF